MAKSKTAFNLADYIVPLNMNGMRGRMLRLPAPKNKQREILMVYGHHASIERMQGFAEELNKYGAVTVPDLPGMGGMDSFYKVGEVPSLDNMADYLAAFVKLRYRRKRVTILAMSWGFVIATHMLQRYPELVKKVDLLISIVGFVHAEDFVFSNRTKLTARIISSVFSGRLTAGFVQHVILRGPIIRATYRLVADKHVKLRDADEAEREKRIKFEIGLWQMNDIRTYMDNMFTMLKLDLCNAKVDLPVWHVSVEPDRYFDNQVVEQHMNIIFNEVTVVHSKMKGGHAPTVIANAKEAAPFIPAKIRRLLAKK